MTTRRRFLRTGLALGGAMLAGCGRRVAGLAAAREAEVLAAWRARAKA